MAFLVKLLMRYQKQFGMEKHIILNHIRVIAVFYLRRETLSSQEVSLSAIKHLENIGQAGDESLNIFMRNMAMLDQNFVNLMTSGVDFTLKFEIHGNKGRMIHCRVTADGFERPDGVADSPGRKRS